MVAVKIRYFQKYFLWTLFLLSICRVSKAVESPKLTEADENRIGQQFMAIYKQSKTYGELLARLPNFGPVDVMILSKLRDSSSVLPKLKWKDRNFIFDGKDKVSIISLNDLSFSVNGRSFNYDPSQDLISNLQKVDRLLSHQSFHKFDFFITVAEASPLNPALLTPFEKVSKLDLPGYAADTIVTGGLGGQVVKTVVSAVIVLPVHYAAIYAEASRKPSCEQQVSELQKLLKDNHIGLSNLQCGNKDLDMANPGADGKSVSFWAPNQKQKTINADWINGIAWEDPNSVYIFGRDIRGREQLTSYRTVNPKFDRTSRLSSPYLQFTDNSKEFAAARNSIEPYRQILKYLGENLSCYKCHDEIKNKLETTKPPNYMSTKPSQKKAQAAQ